MALALLLVLTLGWWAARLLIPVVPLSGADTVVLSEDQPRVDVWPAVRILEDRSGELTVAQAIERLDEFVRPHTPKSSLGPRAWPVWIEIPLSVATGDGRWVLDIDYPVLGKADVYVLRAGTLESLPQLGSSQPFDSRPMHSRSHSVEIKLDRGAGQTILMRVHTTSSMVLPITLSKPQQLQMSENRTLVVQGAMLGVGLSLLAYTLAYGLALREPLYLMYAVMLLGSTVFFADAFGILQMLLRFDRTPAVAMISPLSVLAMLLAGIEFAMRTLSLRTRARRTARVLRVMSGVALVVIVLGVLQVMPYRQVQLAATVLGPLGPLLLVHPSLARAREGDAIGGWMLFGWMSFLVGAFTIAGMLRGLLPSNTLTMHIFQIGSVLESLSWLRILSITAEATRRQAEHDRHEASRLQTLSRTDHLTGLPNRRGLEHAIDAALGKCGEHCRLAVFVGDLDGFKAVNDRLGHEAGDELLKTVAHRLKAHVRHGDFVARLGGDEFVVLLENLSDDADAHVIGQKLLDAFDEPFVVAGHSARVGLTLGYAIAPQQGVDAEVLLRLADMAMYRGKRSGRAQISRAAPSEFQRLAGEPA